MAFYGTVFPKESLLDKHFRFNFTRAHNLLCSICMRNYLLFLVLFDKKIKQTEKSIQQNGKIPGRVAFIYVYIPLEKLYSGTQLLGLFPLLRCFLCFACGKSQLQNMANEKGKSFEQ